MMKMRASVGCPFSFDEWLARCATGRAPGRFMSRFTDLTCRPSRPEGGGGLSSK
jgi:hypothetical protein